LTSAIAQLATCDPAGGLHGFLDMRLRGAAVLAVLSLGASCTQPDVLAPISHIQAPTRAAEVDTLRISFQWVYGGCEVGVGVRTRSTPSQLIFSAYKRDGSGPGLNCPDVLRLNNHTHIVLPSQRSGTFTLIFRQPSGNDDVRVVAQQ
jgi:hypothetical protein